MPNAMLKVVPATLLKLKSVQSESLPIPGAEPWYVSESDPALSVMIDFRSRHSVTVPETASVDEALDHMKHAGVKCAFVIDEKKSAVVGMITAYDILGEKPQQHMHFTGVGHDDVLVKDIMQKIGDWRVANIRDIEQSTVGDVLEVFHETGVTHLPVMETTEINEQRLRGLLSYAKIKRLLADVA
ncbi:MAG: CBS domain-containing protein [Nitrosomonadales bacterium]|nr:CBS domain-containing protein [Nitrosomonadales bacterium]